MERPIDPSAGVDTSKVSVSAMDLYASRMKLYDENSAIIRSWDLADDKSLGIMQLKMADKMQYLKKSTAAHTWMNIQEQFNKCNTVNCVGVASLVIH